MKVTHRLSSPSLASVPAEASWAEAMGYTAISKNENANDSFMTLALAATSTTSSFLQTSVAIAFPRSPMITAYASRDLQDLSKGRFRLGLGTQVKGHIERRFSTSWEAPGPRLREYVPVAEGHLDCMGHRRTARLPRRALPVLADDPLLQPRARRISAPTGLHRGGERLQLPGRRRGGRRPHAPQPHLARVRPRRGPPGPGSWC